MAELTTLYLLRHGEIDRPPVYKFDDATLTPEGRRQVHRLALNWPHPVPDIIYASHLPRSVETASILAAVFRIPVRTMHQLEEWAATEQDVPQEVYRELERKCWADFDFQNERGESLRHARRRIRSALRKIAHRHPGRHAVVSGHSILLALFLLGLRHRRATEAMKDRIGFAHYAIVEFSGRFRIVRDFAP